MWQSLMRMTWRWEDDSNRWTINALQFKLKSTNNGILVFKNVLESVLQKYLHEECIKDTMPDQVKSWSWQLTIKLLTSQIKSYDDTMNIMNHTQCVF